MRIIFMLLLVSALGCASIHVLPHEQLEGVSLSFDHLGRLANPLEQRMGESGEIAAAKQSGDEYWLQLSNQSKSVITFRTYSSYMKPPVRWYDLSNGNKVIALEDGMEISLPFGVESRKGADVPFGPAIDMFWQSYLPPARSVLFGVPRATLRKGRRVYVEFETAGEPNAKTYRVYFQEASQRQ